jgi:hypothetical protein
MLIQDFLQVTAPYAMVQARLLEPAPPWLSEAAGIAYAQAERLFQVARPESGEVTGRKRVQIELGAGYPRGEGFVVPVSWWARDAQRLFPTLDADLEAMPLGPDQVMLTLMGRYDLPSAPWGLGLDRLLMHRVTESCVRSFLWHTAAHLTEAMRAA